MGEYVTFNGYQSIKLGTMDDFRYVRRDELERWRAAFGVNVRAQDDSKYFAEYLKGEGGWLYRFPFPGEDNQSPDDTWSRTWDVPRVFLWMPGVEIEHIAPGARYPVNDKPCREQSENIGTIHGERYNAQGLGRTVFACPRCSRLFAVDDEDLLKIIEANMGRRHLHGILLRLKSATSPKPALISAPKPVHAELTIQTMPRGMTLAQAIEANKANGHESPGHPGVLKLF